MKLSSKTKSRIIIALSLAFFLLFSVALWSVFRVRENSAFAETDATKIATALNGAAGDWKTQTTVQVGDETNENGAVVVINAAAVTDPSDKIVIRSGARVTVNEVDPSVQRELENTAVCSQIVFDVHVTVQKEAVLTFNADVVFRAGVTVEGTLVINGMAFNQNGQMLVSNKANDYAEIKSEGVIVNGSLNNDGARGGTIAVSEGATLTVSEPTTSSYLEGDQKKEFSNHDGGALFLKAGADGASGLSVSGTVKNEGSVIYDSAISSEPVTNGTVEEASFISSLDDVSGTAVLYPNAADSTYTTGTAFTLQNGSLRSWNGVTLLSFGRTTLVNTSQSAYYNLTNVNLGGGTWRSAVFTQGANELIFDGGAKWSKNANGGFTSGAKTEFLLGDNAEQSAVYTTSFSSSSPLIKVGGSYDSTSVLNVYGGVSIVRNAVSASDVRGGGISLSNYSDLNLYGGKIAYNANLSIRQNGGGAGIIGNGNDISINIYGGAVTRNALTSFNSGESSADGAGISLESGNFSENTVLSLYGGEISYNHGSDGLGSTVSSAAQAADGGGVRIHTGIFNLYGGAVSHNYTGGFGGGVIMWLSELNMTGGEISGNHAAFGGGVAMTSNTKSTNTDSEQYTSMASVSGGKVTGNVAAERNTTQSNSKKIGGYGGGICVGAQGYYFGSKVTLSGNVEISANHAVYGGGLAVYADNGSDGGYSSYSNSNYLEMNGGTITGNTADSDEKGSGAYVSCVDRSGNVGYGEIRRSLLLLSGNASIDSSNNVSFAISTNSSNAPIQVTEKLTGSGLAALVRLSSESSWIGKSIVSYASSEYVDRNKFLLDSTSYSFYESRNTLRIHSVSSNDDYVAEVYDSTNTTLQNRYPTLEDAVAAAQDGQIVRVLRSATIASPISISGENITILPAEGEDITVGVASGFKLTAGVQALFTVSGGSLTIGNADSGKLAFDGNKSAGTDMALVSVSNGGSFTLGENATLRNNASSGNAGAVYLGEGTSAEIRGEIADTSGKFGAIYVSNYATLTVNGATFSGRCQNEKGENYAVYAIGENSKVILDGEVNFGGAETGAVPYDGNAVYMENRITLGDNFRNAGFAIGVTFPAARTAGTTIVEIPLSFVTAWNGAPVEGYASAAEYADKKFDVANMDSDYMLIVSNADTTVANALVVSKSVVFVFDFTYTDGFDGSSQSDDVTFPGDLKQLLESYVPAISPEQLGRIHTRGDLVVLELQSGSNFPLAAFSGYAAREGYSLIRWEVNGSDTSYDYNGNIAYLDSEQEVSVRSVWVSNTYNITFDTNSVTGSNTSGFQGFGGTMDMQTIEYDDADKNLKTNAYTLVGWKFTGWNTSAAAETEAAIGDGEEPALTAIATGTPAYTTGVGEDGKVRITGAEYNITLYAQWEPIFSGAGVGTENSPFLLKTVNDLYILEATVNGTAKGTDQNAVYSALSDYYNTNKATDGSVDYTAEDYAGYYFKLDKAFDNASSPFAGVIGRVSTAAVAGGAHENDGVYDHLDQEDQISRAVYGTDSATTGGTGVAEGTPFKGTFDGNGRTVTLNINKQAVEGGNGTVAGDETLVGVGLFGYTDHATVRNLTLDGKVHGYAHVGGLIGYAFGGTVSDIYNKADITSGGHDVGGVVGTFYELLEAYTLSSVSSVANEGSVSYLHREGKDMTKKLDVDNDWNELEIMSDAVGVRFGGLVGAGVTLRLTGGYNLGAVTARYGVGGVVGTLRSLTNSIAEDAMITQSFNKGDIAATAGLYATYTLSSGYRQNFITAYTGGITGRLVGVSSVSYSYNSGNVSATFVAQIPSSGGTIGDENDYTYVGDQTLSELQEGNYLGARGVGGVVGFTSFDVTSASQSGRMAISNLYNTGNVTSWAGVGGIAGYLAYSNITNSFNGGNVTATGFHFVNGVRYNGGYMLTSGSDTVYAAYLGAIVGRGVSASLDATVSYNANAAYSGYTDATVQAIGDSEHNAKFGLDQNISSAIGLTSSQMRVDASGSAPSGFASTFNSTGWAFYTYPEEDGVNYSYYPQLSAFANTAGTSETWIGGTAIDLAAYSKASAQIKYRTSSEEGEEDTPVTDETTFNLTFILNGGEFAFAGGVDGEQVAYHTFADKNKHYYDAGSGNWYYVFGYPVDKVDYVSEEVEAVGSSALEQPDAPSRVGYAFAGWYADSGFTEQFSFGAIPGQNTTVYAKWEPVVYTITYENVVGVGGTWSGEYNKTFDIQTSGQILLPTDANLERRGYLFSGWEYAGAEGFITQYSVSGGNSPSILLQDANGTNKATVPFSALTAGTLVLTARWTEKPYTIEYRTEPTEGFADRQTATLDNPVKSYTVASADITLPIPQKTGYTFLRWILVSIDDNTESISDAINAEHYSINGAVERIRSNTVGDFVLQAEWSRNEITVYLDARGGTIENHEKFGLQYDGTTGLYSAKVPYYDTLANLLFDGTEWKIKTVGLTGNTFNGWYTNSTASPETKVSSSTRVTVGSGSWTLYAGYETAKYTLKIDIQGNLPERVTASVPSEAQGALKAFGFSFENGNITLSVFHGEDASPALAELVKCIKIVGANNYNFSSWEFPADKSIYNVTADFVLSAQYAQDRVTVNFVGRNGEFLKGISVGVGEAIGEENTEYHELLNDTRLTDVLGYTFEKKWTHSVGGVTQEFTLDTPVTGAIVVYAVFTPWTVNPTFTFEGDPTEITVGGLTYSFGSAFGKLPTMNELRAAYTGSEDYLGYQIDGFYYLDEGLSKSVNINTAITADMCQQSGLSDPLVLNLYVKISKITYNITFSVGDGGTFDDQGNVTTYNGEYQYGDVDSVRYGDEDSVKGFPVPKREGYTPTRWYVSRGGEEVGYIDIPVAEESTYAQELIDLLKEKQYEGALNVIAIWKINLYDVWFYAGEDGYFTVPETTLDGVTFYSDPDTPVTTAGEKASYCVVQAEYNKVPSLPASVSAKKDGNTFNGWLTSDNTIVTAVRNDTTYPSDRPITAQWIVSSYTIVFITDGGTPVADKAGVKYGADLANELSGITTLREGYTFKGWFMDSGFQTPCPSTMPDYTLVLYAKWEINVHTLTLNITIDGVTGAEAVIQTAVESALETTASVTPSSAGSYRVTVSGVKYGTSLAALNSLFVTIGETKYTLNGLWISGGESKPLDTMPAHNYEASATFTHKTEGYTVTFYLNDGTETPYYTLSGVTSVDGNLASVLKPTRAGHDFVGWYDAQEGGNAFEFDSSVLKKDTVLYAHWTVRRWTVTLDLRGGSGTESDVDVPYGTAMWSDGVWNALLGEKPSRGGYVFDGWYIDSSCTESAKKTVMPDGNLTLYAGWTAVNYRLTFKYNGRSETFTGAIGSVIGYPDSTSVGKAYHEFVGWEISSTDTNNGKPFSYTLMPDLTPLGGTETDGVVGLTLVAQYEAIEYSAKYRNEDGSVIENLTVSADQVSADRKDLASAEEKTGYNFLGWRVVYAGGVPSDKIYTRYRVAEGGIYLISSEGPSALIPFDYVQNIDFYTVYGAIGYTVTLDPNAGTVQGNASKQVSFDSAYGALPMATRTGYTFLGWFTAQTGGEQVTESTVLKTASDHTLYAQWKAITYTVIFIGNGASGSMDPLKVTYDTPVSLTKNTFELGGYSFAVWNTQPDGGGKRFVDKYNTGAGDLTSENNGIVILYAQWKAIEYTITYHDTDGSGATQTQTFTYADENFASAVLQNFTRTGYIFTGWATSKGGYVAYADKAPLSALALPTDGTEIHLYAKWAANEYTVRFDGDGATGAMNDQTFVFGKEGTLGENAFVNVGYDFGGWTWKGQSYGGTFTVTADNLPESGTVITLTAVWTEKTYTIVYEEKGGETVSDAENVAFSASVPLPTATRTGYAFLGWATSDGGNVVYAGGAQVPVNLLFTGLEAQGARQKTLYAKWEAIEYTISYVLNGGTNGANPATYTVETETIVLNAPNRTGYTPLGWYDKEEGGNKVTEIAKGSTGNVTLYAIWEAEGYPVTVNAGNGGSFSELPEGAVGTEGTEGSWTQFTITLKYGTDVTAMLASLEVNVAAYHHLSDWSSAGDLKFLTGALTVTAQYTATEGAIVVTVLHADGTVYTINATYGEPLSESEAFTHTSTGYTYNGWYYLDGEELTEFTLGDTPITRPITIYPNATAIKYDVTTSASNVDFVGGGDKVAAYGQSYTVTYLPALGYELSDLTVTMSGQRLAEGDYSYDAATGRLTIDRITGAIAISATVSAKDYTVTFDPNGGELTDGATLTVTFGEKITKPETNPTKTGYTFDGWTYNGTAWNFESGTMPAGNITLVASWQINVYKVTFNADGAKSEAEYLHGAKVTRPVDPVKDGYTFLGWFAGESETAYDFTASLTGDLTLTAKFDPIEYTITYVLNGGANGANPATYDVNTPSFTLKDASRTGYTFAGWFDADENGNQIVAVAGGKTGNITLYARWTANSYTVVFNANGGDNAMGGLTLTYDVAAQLTECTLRRNGYTFAGWATSENGAIAYLDGATVINLASESGAKFTLYAVWTANTYKVTFDSDGGTAVTGQTVAYGGKVSEPAHPTKEGHTFEEWTYNGESWDFESDTMPASDIELVAQWKANEYTVTFDPNGGTAVTEQTVAYGGKVSEPETNPTKTGYTFAEWTYNGTTWNFDSDTVPAGNITLVAKWTANTYKIVFHANDGSETTKEQSVTYDQKTALDSNSFTRSGYTFAGWATSENGAIAYLDGATVINLTSESGAKVTLYAVWTANTYKVTFDSDGGTAVTGQTVAYGGKVSEPAQPTKEGHTFEEWTYNGTTWDFESDTMPASDIELVAQWKANEYTVTFDPNGGTAVTEQTVAYGGKVSKPAQPTRAGYTFEEWTYNGTTWNFDSDTVPAGNITLVAKWTANTYKIVFHANDGSEATQEQSLTYDQKTALDSNSFTRSGYTFAGWATSENGAIAYLDGATVINLTSESGAKVTLYAVWTANTYKVTVELTMPDSTDAATIAAVRGYVANALSKWNVTIAQSGTSLTVTVADLPYGTSLGNLNELFRTEENYSQITANGALYLFVWTDAPDDTLSGNAEYAGGWTNEDVKTVTVSVDGEESAYYVTEKDGSYTFDLASLAKPEKRGSVFGGWQASGGTVEDTVLTITDDGARVEPVWRQITYTVTYGGAEIAQEDLVFTWDGTQFTLAGEGGAAELAEAPDRTGYTFAGWQYEELTVFALEDLFAGSALGNAGGTNENVTIALTAFWAENEYTVRFDGDGATGAMNDRTFVFGKEGTLGANAFVKVGYDFGGWSLNGQIYTDTFTVTADTLPEAGTVITLTAVWTEKTYTVVYDEKGGETLPDAEDAAFSGNITLPAAEREGHVFLGWATSDDGNVVYAGGAQVPVNLLFTGLEGTGAREKTLYAVWDINVYTVTLNGANVTLSGGSTVKHGERYTLTLTAVKGYGLPETVSYTIGDGQKQTAQVADGKVTILSVTGDLLIEAAGVADMHLVTVDAGNGGTFATLPDGAKGTEGTEGSWTQFTITLKYGTDVYTLILNQLKLNVTGAPYQTLHDWNVTAGERDWLFALENDLTIEAEYAQSEVTVSVVLPDGTVRSEDVTYNRELDLNALGIAVEGYTISGWRKGDEPIEGGKLVITAPVAIYAVATADTYEITLDFGDGTNTTVTVTFGKTFAYAAGWVEIPVREGYTFLGWKKDGIAVSGNQIVGVLEEGYTLTADWSANEYTVTFYANGGQLKDDETVKVTFGTALTAPVPPEREGYTFAGWYYNLVEWDFGKDTMPASNITLVASWTIDRYTVTFVNGTEQSEAEYSHGSKITQPTAPTKKGYTFLGWYAEGSETAYDFTSAVTGDLTLTAKWEAIEYTISYVLNGGANGANPATYTVETETIALIAPNRTGYVFLGWYDKEEGGNKVTEIAKGSTGNVTLYAVWEAEEYEVTFVANGGTEVNAQTIAYGGKATQPTAPTRTGYTFLGWFAGESETAYDFTSAVTGDLTLTAKWEAIEYTISYVLNGGTNGENPATYTVKTETVALNAPNRTGYVFLGWYDKEEGGNKVTEIAKGSTGNITLYAVWEAEEYEVTFVANGGTEVNAQTVAYGGTVAYAEVTRDNYMFVGWFTDEALTQQYSFNTAVTGDLTLYAKWRLQVVTGTAEDGATVMVSSDVGFDDGTRLVFIRVTEEALLGKAGEGLAKNMKLARLYDIALVDAHGNSISLSQPISVGISVEGLDDPAGKYGIAHIPEEGAAEELATHVGADGRLYFFVEHFSYYAVVDIVPMTGFAWWWFLVAIGACAAVVLAAILIWRSRHVYELNYVNGGIAPQKLKESSLIDLPIPERESEVFDGWYYDEEFRDRALLTTMPKQNLILFAKWRRMTEEERAARDRKRAEAAAAAAEGYHDAEPVKEKEHKEETPKEIREDD